MAYRKAVRHEDARQWSVEFRRDDGQIATVIVRDEEIADSGLATATYLEQRTAELFHVPTKGESDAAWAHLRARWDAPVDD